MKVLIISLLVLIALPYCFAQSAGTIKRAYAYYNVSMPGIQMLDVDGNPVTPKPNITRFIYIEYRGIKMPDIKEVLYNGSGLSFSIVTVKEKTVLVGDKALNPNNSITARKGHSLLKIQLQPADGKTMPDTGCKNIVIKSKLGGKISRFYVTSEKELVTPPMY
jgi:hypothetical protein